MREVKDYLTPSLFPRIRRGKLKHLQVNLGYKCNQSCVHCHVNAGPNRKEMMSDETSNELMELLSTHAFHTLDLTGGAPELHPRFRDIVRHAGTCEVRVIDRCNLTILMEPAQNGLAEFLADQKVEITASLPCYTQDTVDRQRGKGVFAQSIASLHLLNKIGYGHTDTLKLNLVYNPSGAFLPPEQHALEATYKEKLFSEFGIVFNRLYTITNMPIQRFGSTLLSKGELENYLSLLIKSHNHSNLQGVMCKETVSVDWQGFIYDCDFNQMLQMPILSQDNTPLRMSSIGSSALEYKSIITANHCFGCTAGSGSSCTGSLKQST